MQRLKNKAIYKKEKIRLKKSIETKEINKM